MPAVRAVTLSVSLTCLRKAYPRLQKELYFMEKSLVISPSCICKSPMCLLRGILSEVVSCLFSLFPYFCVDYTQHLFTVNCRLTVLKLGIWELTQSCSISVTGCFNIPNSLWVFGDHSLHFFMLSSENGATLTIRAILYSKIIFYNIKARLLKALKQFLSCSKMHGFFS